MEDLNEQISDNIATTSGDDMHDATFRGPPRHTRRLSDKVLVAFHQACDTPDFEIAEHLLRVLEIMLMRPSIHVDSNRPRNAEGFVAAHERLWYLQHPTADQ